MVKTLIKGKTLDDPPRPVEIPVILPDKLLMYLIGSLGLHVSQESIHKYWSHAKLTNCPWANVSPGDHVPLGLYGDAAKYAVTGQKAVGYFLNIPIWNPKSARMSRWLLFGLNFDTALGAQTLRPLFYRLVESLHRCYAGIEMHGSLKKFAVTELRGDWEWHWYCFGLLRTWRSYMICWRCDASKQPGNLTNSYVDFNDHPQWADTELTELQFLSRCIPPRHV